MKIKKPTIFQLIFIFILTPFVAFGQATDLARVDRNLEERIETGELLGIFIAHISADGEVRQLTKGTLSPDGNQAVSGKTIFEIGSLTKTFTCLLMARMVEEGAFTPDTPIKKILPDSVNVPEYNGKEITLRHLATHTSGLPRMPTNFRPKDPADPYADYSIKQMYDFLSDYTLPRAPAAPVEYSNFGMGLLGHILELQSGRSYEALVKKYIANPLQMSATGITISSKDSSRFAAPYNYGKGAKYWHIPTLAGAGALRSTGEDMVRYIKANMGLLSSPLDHAMEQTHTIQFDSGDGNIDKIGLGWFYSTKHDTIIWHNGGTGGFKSFAGYNKQGSTGVVVLSNGKSDITDAVGFYLLDNRHPLPETRQSISLSSGELDRFVGEYKSRMGFSFYVTKEDGRLFIRLTGQNKAPVEPTSKNTFVNRQVAAEFTFDTTKKGDVSGLTLRQRGQEVPAEKVSDKVPGPPKHEEISVTKSVLKQYIGTYQLAPAFSIRITLQDGQLYAQATGQQKFPVFPESKTKFFYKAVEAQLEFIKNEEREFDKVKLYQGGRVLEGKRVEN